jgi:hypothetical protein
MGANKMSTGMGSITDLNDGDFDMGAFFIADIRIGVYTANFLKMPGKEQLAHYGEHRLLNLFKKLLRSWIFLVRLKGFEPLAYGLEAIKI